MKANAGHPDRLIRTFVAIILLAMAIGGIIPAGILKTIAIIVGLVMAVTAAIGVCPMYSVLNKNTCGE